MPTNDRPPNEPTSQTAQPRQRASGWLYAGLACGALTAAIALCAVWLWPRQDPRPAAGSAPPAAAQRPSQSSAPSLASVQGRATPAVSRSGATSPAEAPPARPAGMDAPALGPAAAGYVGSEICSDCHEKQHRAWQHDWHARALSAVSLDGPSDDKGRPTARMIRGPFDSPGGGSAHYRGPSTEAWMDHDSRGYVMRTRDDKGILGAYPVRWVIGGKRMQDTVTVLPGGFWQILPVYFHTNWGRDTPGEWVDYNGAKQGRVDANHPFFWTRFRRNANHECLDCHTTGLQQRYDRATGQFTTGFVDAGVACEACHGPGERHVQSQSRNDIVHPGRLARRDPPAAMALCAQCHGPRQPLFPMLDTDHRYRPGGNYSQLYQPLVLTQGRERSGEYFADGRPNSSSFEYQALVQSRCYLRGQVTCLHCHGAPHVAHGDNELPPATDAAAPLPHTSDAQGTPLPATDPDRSCRRCHGKLFTAAARARHTHHRDAAAVRCVSCHMPKVVTGVLDQFADHALDIPVPQNSARHGVPSACGVCHRDRTPAQLADSLQALWPGAARRQARRIRLADAIDEATARDSEPALRAVLADGQEAPILRAACATLLSQRFPAAHAALLPLLSHPDPLVRTRAVEGLAAAGARTTVDRIAALRDDRALMVRVAVAVALAALGDPRAEPLLQALATGAESRGLMQPHMALGLLAARRGMLSAATAHLEHAVDTVPYNVDALRMLAQLYSRMGRSSDARARMAEAARFAPAP